MVWQTLLVLKMDQNYFLVSIIEPDSTKVRHVNIPENSKSYTFGKEINIFGGR